jgi:hypothetical protein
MITSTNIKRKIFVQKETFQYTFDVSLNNLSGSLTFGFMDSEENILSEIKMELGKVFVDGDFVYSYKANQQLNFLARVSESFQNIFIDNNLITLNASRETGDLEWFFVRPDGVEANFELNFQGKTPQYTISDIVFEGSDVVGQGSIFNLSQDSFGLFGGSISPASYLLTDLPSEVLPGENVFSVGKLIPPVSAESLRSYERDVSVTFFTTFGRIQNEIKEKTIYPINQNLILTIDEQISGVGSVNGILEWENNNGEVLTEQNILIALSLEEVSSEGDFFETWDFAISDLNGDNSVDFLTTNRFSVENKLYKTNQNEYITNGVGAIRITISRKQNLGTDIANLKITGEFETLELEITGN